MHPAFVFIGRLLPSCGGRVSVLSYPRWQTGLSVMISPKWASYRPVSGDLATTVKGAANSALVAGGFLPDGTQVSYIRVISDKTRFAYILDVIVDEGHRGKGLGKRMMDYVLHHPELADVCQWTLITKDAHGLYSQFGFAPTSRPDDWMTIWRLPDYSGNRA